MSGFSVRVISHILVADVVYTKFLTRKSTVSKFLTRSSYLLVIVLGEKFVYVIIQRPRHDIFESYIHLMKMIGIQNENNEIVFLKQDF